MGMRPVRPVTEAGGYRRTGRVDGLVELIRPDQSPGVAIALLLVLAIPVLAFAIGGVPHLGRVGLARGDVVSYQLVANLLLHGVRPYSSGFHGLVPFIYPPGIFAFLLLPSLAGGRYLLAFAVEMLAVVLVGSSILARLARASEGVSGGVGWATLALLCAVGPVTLWRPDPAIGILLAAAVLAWHDRRRALAFVLIALAGLIKDYGWVAFIPMLALQLGDSQMFGSDGFYRGLRVVRAALPALAVLIVVAAAFTIWSHGGLIHSQLQNLSRGVEIESLAAGVALTLPFGGEVTVAASRLGNQQLSGAGLHLPLFTLVFACLGAAVLLLIAWYAYRQKIGAGAAVAATVAAAMVAAPVLSPQYFDALLPCLVIAAAELAYRDRGRLLCLGLLLALLTQLEFPYLWLMVLTLHPYAVAVLEVRNLFLLVLLWALLAWRTQSPTPVAPPPLSAQQARALADP
ncbi:MAG TPA: hypothetical protein VMV09_05235 [Candidatus Saccharimonadales bacterium]|nr:hypothetical protein [Candidatus Saccharimonadales bacterium]